MAGHSHWKSIKHKKGAADARRGKLFSKLAKLITIAARNGGGNPADNLRLRYAIDRARAESMPKDSIDRAVKKGTGELQGEDLIEITYECIGPAGVSFIIESLTDNRNRTGGEIRNLFETRGGSLGKTNSVLWKFDHKGILAVSKDDAAEDELFEAAIEAGADDLEPDGDVFNVYTKPEDFEVVRSGLQTFIEGKRGKSEEKKWGEEEDDRPLFARCEFSYLPQNPIAVGADKAKTILNILSDLEDHDDVQAVYSDFDISAEVMAELDAEA